ncbi:MAG: thermosome subunit alpha [Candidatus Hydrothermarchaeota archaeon]
MTAQFGGKPVLIIPEGATRYTGRDAMRNNIFAARAIAEAVRTTLGPKGMDKMLVDSLGDITITNDGVTILKDIDVEHPAAKMMVEVAKTLDDEVGDGTTTAVVIGGELLKKAEELLDQNIHATVIASGYRLAADKANEILENMAIDISIDDEDMLKQVAVTAMTGKGAEIAKEHLGDLAVKAVKLVAEEIDGEYKVDPDDIKIEKKEGGSVSDTELIEGIVLDKERVHPRMPKTVKDAKIALINAAIEVTDTETDAEIRITDPTQLKAFLDEEEKMLKEMVDKIKKSGANVVFCQKGIDDMAQHFLAKENIFAVRRVKKSDMEKLAKATGASIVNSLDDLTPDDLGEAGFLEEKKIAGEEMVFVTECKYPKAVTLFIRGGTEHVVSEVERGVNDAIRVVESVIEDKKVVPGGGAPEIEVSRLLRSYAETVGGREQLAINAFADAIDVIARTLAENAGLDPIDTLVELRSAHEEGAYFGLNVFTGKPNNMIKGGVIEPLRTKTQAIKSASEAANMILRIDDVIAASKREAEGPPGAPGAPGYGLGEEEF